MTTLIIGTYRTTAYIDECLTSVDLFLRGHDDIVFVDDSGDEAHCQRLATYGKVVATPQVGYTKAMAAVCEVANGEEVFFMEEDFRLLCPVWLDDLSEHLYYRPYLSQVALLRAAYFPAEKEAGGVLEYLASRGRVITEVEGLIELENWTCNPALWRGHVSTLGWPQWRAWSEIAMQDQLTEVGYRGSYLPGVQCLHIGDLHTGHGY